MVDLILDEEILYRRVIYDEQCFIWDSDKNDLQVTAKAFSDPANQPSVDRAKLCKNDPSFTQKDKRNGVVSLIAGEVRANCNLHHEEKNITYLIDVISKPEIENPAHAQIMTAPDISSKNVFRRLRESLARMANVRGWLILPDGYR